MRVQIGDRFVGDEQPCLIIAEAGVNHNGDVDLAYRLIDAAVEAGADAIKFQSFVTEELITVSAPKADYQLRSTGHQQSQQEMLEALELSAEAQSQLARRCDEAGILYLCTPYDHRSIDLLDEIGVPAYKVASTDTTNLPFLRYVASKGRPVILSTGMSTLGEVEAAVGALDDSGLPEKIVLLHCTSEYPTPFAEVNLRAMATLEQATGRPTGFSDHTPGIGASPWAVALGACVIEKHFTLDRDMPGPDHAASVVPRELCELVRTIRDVEAALGDGIKKPMPSELPNKQRMQKSLVVRRTLAAGEMIRSEDLTCKRPGDGLPPAWFDRVVGRRVAVDVRADEVLTLGSIDWRGYVGDVP